MGTVTAVASRQESRAPLPPDCLRARRPGSTPGIAERVGRPAGARAFFHVAAQRIERTGAVRILAATPVVAWRRSASHISFSSREQRLGLTRVRTVPKRSGRNEAFRAKWRRSRGFLRFGNAAPCLELQIIRGCSSLSANFDTCNVSSS